MVVLFLVFALFIGCQKVDIDLSSFTLWYAYEGALWYQSSFYQIGWREENPSLFHKFSNNPEADGRDIFPIIPVTSADKLSEIFTYFEQETGVYWGDSAVVEEIKSNYSEEFFRENTLLLIYLSEECGSNRHRIHRCYSVDGVCTVVVETIEPGVGEAGTCDMAGWIAAVSVEKQAVEGVEFTAYRLRK